MTEQLITIQHLHKKYDATTQALNDLSISFNQGEWTSIMGPSGSGKTTLLNILGCLDTPTAGSVIIKGTDITTLPQKQLTRFRREHIGLIFQQYHLIPYLTALENVMLAQYYHNTIDEGKAVEVLRRVGLDHRLHHIPAHLSGGEQQRVCIARALINTPSILLADEPTGNLDHQNGETVLRLIQDLQHEGHTIILVTHNEDIGKLGDRLIRLSDGQIAADIQLKEKNVLEPRKL
jgi:putative ABC transport system ATP-binding protein